MRIAAGTSSPFTDSEGNQWLPDQGFEGGDVAERDSNPAIANTTDPQLYRTEHYSMDSFSVKIPNGKYVVKLHFAETYEGITGPGQRVFSFNVNGQDFNDFDVFVKAGGRQTAYVETVNVDVTDETLKITFTPGMDNPEINGIEILPVP
ncbi:MAG TPA: malectin [Phycisphaerae bacterium]|nr:malectin [Phycisphaerae bacterium]